MTLITSCEVLCGNAQKQRSISEKSTFSIFIKDGNFNDLKWGKTFSIPSPAFECAAKTVISISG